MFSKPKTIIDENKIEQKTFLQRMVAPVKNALSFFKGLISSERESIVPTLSTPNKFIISKRNQIRNSYEGSTHDAIKIINLRQEPDKNLNINFSETGNEIKQPENSNRSRLTQDINNRINRRQQEEKLLLGNQHLTEEEKNFLRKNNIKLTENFFIGKSFEKPDDKRDKIREVVSSVKYTIENKSNFTQSQINLARVILEDQNFKKLKKNQESLVPIKIQGPLNGLESHIVNKFLNTNLDVGKLLYNIPSNNNNKNNVRNNVRNNISNLSQNNSQSMSNNTNTNMKNIIRIKTSDKVCPDPSKRLFTLSTMNTKKRKFDEHEKSCNLDNTKEEKLCDLVMRSKCGDCLKLKYENNQLKIKLRDSIMQKKRGNSKTTTNEDETPSTIKGNNQSNILMSGSLCFSHSKDSVNNSFISEKGLNKSTRKESNSFINTEINYINQANFKQNQSAIPEDFDEENFTATKQKSVPTPQFRSMQNANNEHHNKEKDSKKLENQNDFKDKHKSVFKETNKIGEINKNPDEKIKSKVLARNNYIDNQEIKESIPINNINKCDNQGVGIISNESDLKIQKEEKFLKNETNVNTKILKEDKLSLFEFKDKKQNDCLKEIKTITDHDRIEFFSKEKHSDSKPDQSLEPVKKESDNIFQFMNYPSSIVNESKPITNNQEVYESNINTNIVSHINNEIKEKELNDENSPNNSNVVQNLEGNKSLPEQSALEGIPKDSGDNLLRKEDNQTKKFSTFLTKETHLVNNPVFNPSLLKSNDIAANIISTKIPADENETKQSTETFSEKPKGSFANNIYVNKQNQNESQIQPPTNIDNETVAKDNAETSEIRINNSDDGSIMSRVITSNTGSSNLLTDNKSNPFLQMKNNTVGRNIIITDKQSIFNQDPLTTYGILGIGGIGHNNNMPNLSIPQSQTNPHNLINNIPLPSPASSTTSDMTFGNRNINETMTNHGTGNFSNQNAFFGTNFSSNMHNNLRHNLSTVSEDEGRMSVENEMPYEGINNTNFKAGFNSSLGNNNLENKYTKSFPGPFNNQFSNQNLNRLDQGNINNNFTSFTQNQSVGNSFSLNNGRFSNNNSSQSNIRNVPSMNHNTFPNPTNNFSRNNFQSDNSYNNNILNSNPFLVNKTNNNTNNSNSGGLGLFDEHSPKPRRNYRK
jgi:hypothetical protein